MQLSLWTYTTLSFGTRADIGYFLIGKRWFCFGLDALENDSLSTYVPDSLVHRGIRFFWKQKTPPFLNGFFSDVLRQIIQQTQLLLQGLCFPPFFFSAASAPMLPRVDFFTWEFTDFTAAESPSPGLRARRAFAAPPAAGFGRTIMRGNCLGELPKAKKWQIQQAYWLWFSGGSLSAVQKGWSRQANYTANR